MVPLASLWLPILVAGVLVFVVSSIIHMVLGYHAGDYGQVSKEDQVMDSLRPFALPPGDYLVPRPGSMAAMRSPEYQAKRAKGPVLMMTVFPSGPAGMGAQLVQWFVFSLVVGLFAGYVAGIVLAPGTPYLTVFRITGTVAFGGYALGLAQQSIWYRKSWGATFRSMFDGLIYGLLTGGSFGWLWPG